MKGASIITWVNREWDNYPNALYMWALIVSGAWLLVLLLDRDPIAIAIALFWTVFWTGLFGWRMAGWLRKLDKRWQRGRKR